MQNELLAQLQTFDSKTIHRGKKYALEGKVAIVSDTDSEIEADVYGSSTEPYSVLIKKDRSRFSSNCSCPIGTHCKHIAATLICSLRARTGSSVVSKRQIEQEPSFSWEESDWLSKLEKTVVEDPISSPKKTGILYLLSLVSRYRAGPSLKVKYQVAKKKKDGSLSRATGKTYDAENIFYSLPDTFKSACEEVDREIIHAFMGKVIHSSSYTLQHYRKMIETGRSLWGSTSTLQWGAEKRGFISWDIRNNGHTLVLKTEPPDAHCILFNDGGIYIDVSTHTTGLLLLPETPAILNQILSAPTINSEKMSWVQKKLTHLFPDLPVKQKELIQTPLVEPIPCLTLSMQKSWNLSVIKGELSFFYGEHRLPPDLNGEHQSSIEVADKIYQIKRRIPSEQNAIKFLRFNYWYGYGLDFKLEFQKDDLEDLLESILALQNKGWKLEIPKDFPIQNITEASNNWYVEVSDSKQHWFDLEIGQKVDGKRVNLVPYLQKFLAKLPSTSFEHLTKEELQKETVLSLDNGDVLVIKLEKIKAIIEPFLGLLNLSTKSDKIQLSDWQVGALSHLQDVLPKKMEWQSPKRYLEIIEQLKHVKSLEIVSPPSDLKAELRDYQTFGLSWLQFLRKYHLAGILADDMGLGKTVQTLAHILLEKEQGRLDKPVLIVCPTTLVSNWLLEANKFTPSLKVITLQGMDRKKYFESLLEYHIIITTYPLLARDQEILLRHQYHLLILDEAQNIKNGKTLAHGVLREIQASHRLCLTGTPMENHLGELWSLFTFLLPGFLGDEKQFQKFFRKPIEKEGSLERKKTLQKRIAPFILRRTKQEVVLELPPKTEMITNIELTEKQQELYEAVRLTMMKKVMAEVEAKGLAKSRIVLLDALLKLRQICCDPRLIKTSKEHTIEHSAKMLHLRENLPQMIANKQRILLFSQFTSMLSLIEDLLQELSIPYVMITGETQDRRTPVQDFQSGKVPLFLISLKAGGTGLNLTAADTVIHYDPWWNPAVETQATDRAHRMGQTKPVFVYKWISTGSVEEKILQLQSKKKALAESLFAETTAAKVDLNLEDLQSLFAPLS